MAVFFTCITLAGSGIVLFVLLLMLAEKRRIHDYRKDAAEKKDELIQVIEDAELLIDEMNKFSVYTVSKLEEKNDMLNQTIHEADRRIEAISSLLEPASGTLPAPVQVKTDTARESGNDKNTRNEQDVSGGQDIRYEQDIDSIINSQLFKKGKVIPFDVKRREILKLSKSGLDSVHIARLLNMGRGEIELIERISR
ncbi:MAG: hypothetical protein GX027_01310 [Clostridiaceae bacterium]|jgi:hypothetical protein|nr:hypothetical protein [Clostridiaceae bacterium]